MISNSNIKMRDKSSNSSNEPQMVQQNRVSVFEPYPMRDAVQHFCEKHIDKIKAYMQKVFVKIPLPVKCTIEERKSKKVAKLHFVCQGKGEHCLYSKTYFIMKTRNARIWIHLMFLALQAKAMSPSAPERHQSIALKNCWDTLKADNRTFLTLVTSSFPSTKDQDLLIQELRSERYFDVFESMLSSRFGVVFFAIIQRELMASSRVPNQSLRDSSKRRRESGNCSEDGGLDTSHYLVFSSLQGRGKCLCNMPNS